MLLLLAATPLESARLRRELSLEPDDRQPSFSGEHCKLLHCGIGPVSTALHLTRFLEHHHPAAVLMIGCGGSYPNSGLAVGDLALASSETFGDLGAATDEGFLSLEQMDIPLTPQPVQTFPLTSPLLSESEALLSAATERMRLVTGPFVTVSTCSSHAELSRALEARTGGICENMEGAAAAQVCAHYRLPFLELRGISNPTGTRDPQQWDLPRAADAAQRGALQLINHWSRLEELACSS